MLLVNFDKLNGLIINLIGGIFMNNKKPILYIILGAFLTITGTYLPNGVEFLNYVEFIGIYNLFVTIAQGLGIGLLVGGTALYLKQSFFTKNKS